VAETADRLTLGVSCTAANAELAPTGTAARRRRRAPPGGCARRVPPRDAMLRARCRVL
jgi:hypothetical protein